MLTENKYRDEDLLVHLRAVFGQVDRIRNQIDQALQQDDALRTRREMRFLLLTTRFLRPESMEQGDITVLMNWIREETEVVMNQLDEELIARVIQMTLSTDQPMEFFSLYRTTFRYLHLYKHLQNKKISVNLANLCRNHWGGFRRQSKKFQCNLPYVNLENICWNHETQ